MESKKWLLFILSFLLLLPSCRKADMKSYYDAKDWQSLREASEASVEEGITKEALYYLAVSSYYTGDDRLSVDASVLYLTMYDRENPVSLKILLYKADDETAYRAGSTLRRINALNSSDKVQYFKILNALGRSSDAYDIMKELRDSLPPYDFCFAMINGNAVSDLILDALSKVYGEGGVSREFLSLADKAFLIFSDRHYYLKAFSFIEDTFDGNSTYALIAGDFFFSANDVDSAVKYWKEAEKSYPAACRERLELLVI